MPETPPPTRLQRLVALRDAQAAALSGDVPAREFASLSKEYRSTLAEIAELEPNQAEGDGVDEIARRRAARRSGSSAGSGRTKRPG